MEPARFDISGIPLSNRLVAIMHDTEVSQKLLEEWLHDHLDKGPFCSEQEVLDNLLSQATAQLWALEHIDRTSGFADSDGQFACVNDISHGASYLADTAIATRMSLATTDVSIALQRTEATSTQLFDPQPTMSYGDGSSLAETSHPDTHSMLLQLLANLTSCIGAHQFHSAGNAKQTANDVDVSGGSSAGEVPLESYALESTPQSLPRCWEHGCNGRSFKSLRNYRRHVAEQKGLDSAACSRCGVTFNRKSNCDKHESTCVVRRRQEGRRAKLAKYAAIRPWHLSRPQYCAAVEAEHLLEEAVSTGGVPKA